MALAGSIRALLIFYLRMARRVCVLRTLIRLESPVIKPLALVF